MPLTTYYFQDFRADIYADKATACPAVFEDPIDGFEPWRQALAQWFQGECFAFTIYSTDDDSVLASQDGLIGWDTTIDAIYNAVASLKAHAN